MILDKNYIFFKEEKPSFSGTFNFDEGKFLRRYAIMEDSNKSKNLNIMNKLFKLKSRFRHNLHDRELEKAIDSKRVFL